MPLFAPRRLRVGVVGLVYASAGLLGACAQPAVPGPAAAACTPSLSAASTEIRVMVRFRQPVDGASADVMQRLQQAGGCVSWRASASPTLHTYSFAGVGDVDRLRENLRSWPWVLDVVVDQKTGTPGPR